MKRSFSVLILVLCPMLAWPWGTFFYFQTNQEAVAFFNNIAGNAKGRVDELLKRPNEWVIGESFSGNNFGEWPGVAELNFLYSGDTTALNRFLEEYVGHANLTHQLIIHPDQRTVWIKDGMITEPTEEFPGKCVDWAIQIIQKPLIPFKMEVFEAKVDVWVGGNVNRKDMVIPLCLSLESGEEIEVFVEDHSKPKENEKAGFSSKDE